MNEDYNIWLNSDRKHREMHFQITVALAKIRGKFSYLRIEGLSELAAYLRSLKEEDYEIFCRLQDVRENNIAQHIMKVTFRSTTVGLRNIIHFLSCCELF
jgi:hypothetical protein